MSSPIVGIVRSLDTADQISSPEVVALVNLTHRPRENVFIEMSEDVNQT